MTSLEGQKYLGIKQRKFAWPPRLPSQNQGHNTKLALAHIVNDFIKRKSSSKECSGQSEEEKKLKSNRQPWEEGPKQLCLDQRRKCSLRLCTGLQCQLMPGGQVVSLCSSSQTLEELRSPRSKAWELEQGH